MIDPSRSRAGEHPPAASPIGRRSQALFCRGWIFRRYYETAAQLYAGRKTLQRGPITTMIGSALPIVQDGVKSMISSRSPIAN